MKATRLWRVVRMNLRRDRRGFVLSAGGVAVGIAAFVFFVALGAGVGTVVRERIFPVEANLVEVVPPKVSLGSFLGGGVLDDAQVARLEAIPGVARAYRKMELKVPAVTRYDGDFFGRRVRMGLEIIGVGVDPGYVAGDLGPQVSFEDPGPGGGPVPVVVARRLLEIYNASFARARGLPQLDPSMVVGFRFPLTLGASYVTRTGGGPTRTVTLEVVGVSDRALLGGVTLPLGTVRRWNRALAGDEAASRYQSVVLEAAGADRVPAITAAVRRMGFEIDPGERRLAEQVGAAVALTTLALSLLSALILALAAVNIARASYAQVAARVRELGLLRAVGARRGDVRALLVVEALVAGAVGAAAGILLAAGGAFLADLLAARLLPPFPFKPDSFFLFPWWLVPAAFAAGVLSAVAGAFFPAAAAARLDPARALTGG